MTYDIFLALQLPPSLFTFLPRRTCFSSVLLSVFPIHPQRLPPPSIVHFHLTMGDLISFPGVVQWSRPFLLWLYLGIGAPYSSVFTVSGPREADLGLITHVVFFDHGRFVQSLPRFAAWSWAGFDFFNCYGVVPPFLLWVNGSPPALAI